MHYFIQKQVNQATEHPSTTPGDGKMWLDATSDTDFTTVSNLISVAKDKYKFADQSQSVAGSRPTLVSANKEIDFNDTTDHLTSGAAPGNGYIFSTSDGLSIFALVKSNTTNLNRFLLDFGNQLGTNYSILYNRELLIGTSPTSFGGVTASVAITNSTVYRRIALVIDFDNFQTLYLNNVQVKQDAITLSQITLAEINENPTRAVGKGPVTVGLQSKSDGEAFRFYGRQLKCIMVISNAVKAINRDRLDKFMQILEAR